MQITHCTFSYLERRSKDYQVVEVREGVEYDLDANEEWEEAFKTVRKEVTNRVRPTAIKALATLIAEEESK